MSKKHRKIVPKDVCPIVHDYIFFNGARGIALFSRDKMLQSSSRLYNSSITSCRKL